MNDYLEDYYDFYSISDYLEYKESVVNADIDTNNEFNEDEDVF